MIERDSRALHEVVRLCDQGMQFAARGRDWYVSDPLNAPGLAAESIIIKIGENVSLLSPDLMAAHPRVPWSSIKRMRDRLAHHYEATDYDAIWDTLIADLPRVRDMIHMILDENGK